MSLRDNRISEVWELSPTFFRSVAHGVWNGGQLAPRSLAEISSIVRERHEKIQYGDLLRASVWKRNVEDPDIGAEEGSKAVLAVFNKARIVERVEGDRWQFRQGFLEDCTLEGDVGVQLQFKIGTRSYDFYVLNADEEKRVERERVERANAHESVLTTARRNRNQGARPVLLEDARKTEREKMETAALRASMRAFGYLRYFPVVLNADGSVNDGRHRQVVAAEVREELLAEQNGGSDPLLEERIKTLDWSWITEHASVRTSDDNYDELAATIAGAARISWTPGEREKAVQALVTSGHSIAEAAAFVGQSERWVRHHTEEARRTLKQVRIERAREMAAEGMTQGEIAEALGVSEKTVRNYLSGRSGKNGSAAKTTAKQSEAQQIRSLADLGKTQAEIAEALGFRKGDGTLNLAKVNKSLTPPADLDEVIRWVVNERDQGRSRTDSVVASKAGERGYPTRAKVLSNGSYDGCVRVARERGWIEEKRKPEPEPEPEPKSESPELSPGARQMVEDFQALSSEQQALVKQSICGC